MIAGVEVAVSRRRGSSSPTTPLAVVSAAGAGAGLTTARAVVTLHVLRSHAGQEADTARRNVARARANAGLTVTEVKTMALMTAGVRGPDDVPATGTSTHAFVAAAGRGPWRRFGGPPGDPGWPPAHAARTVLTAGVRRRLEERA